MSFTLRELQSHDKSAWRQLWCDYLAFYQTTVSDDVYDTTFDRLLSQNHPKQNAFLALEGSCAIGLVHYIYHNDNWKLEDATYLQDLYTEPDFRGQGAGRLLIEAVYKAADDNNSPTVYWQTEKSNKTARVLYDKIAKLAPFIIYER